MTAYYNEIDPYASAWLRNLADAGHVAPGTIDDRSIADVRPDDIGTGQAHFFAGIGGWSYALRLAGVPDDARVWTGSCPCQPFSSAGARAGFADPRDLWPVWRRLIDQRRPVLVLGEQVVDGDWIDRTTSDLRTMGYAFRAAIACASLVGAPPRRRLFFAAHHDSEGESLRAIHAEVARVRGATGPPDVRWSELRSVGSGVDGIPRGMGRLRAYGNAIVPQVAAAFIVSALDAIQETA